MTSSQGTEREVLRACARRTLDAGSAERLVSALSGVADWDRLHALAVRNGLVSLLHRHLGASGLIDLLPPDAADRLRSDAAEDAWRALRLAGELVRLMELFRARGLRAAAYKGPALAVRAYGDPGLRRCSDLDLLVHPGDADAAMRVLAERGYAPRHRFTPAQDALFRRVDGDYPFWNAGSETLVELHTRVSPARFLLELPTAELLARARPVRLGGGSVPALADHDLFLALAAHGAKHRWERLEWLASAAELARGGSIDLAALLERAGRTGARRTVRLALLLAHRLLGLPLPAAVRREIASDRGLAGLAEEAEGRMFRAPGEDEEDATPAENLLYNLRARDSAADRVRYAARWLLVPTPEDWLALPLPRPLAPLHRLLRPLRLAARYGARALPRR